MKLIYQNFDGLEASFQCAVPPRILAELERAKKEAQATKNPVYAEIGPNKLPVMVHETGAKGGYTYQLSTGPDGEIWLIGDRENREHWNVRVRVRSLCLALYGFKAVKERILRTLINDLRAKGPDDNEKIPQERISRVDYCLDFLIEGDFKPYYSNFVCGGRTKKSQFGSIPYNQIASGQFIDTITVGKMPNRQVTIYNKTKEITAKHKKYWLKLWGLETLEIEGQIWRVEIRAGKKELNKWNLRTFDDFEEKIGDVITHTLKDFKYTVPNDNDKNQSRWPLSEIWELSIRAARRDLFSYISNADRKEILKEIRETIINRYEKLISGIFVSYTAATGKDISEIPGVLDAISGQLLEEIAENPQKFIQKHKKAADKFSLLDNKEKPEINSVIP